MVAVFAVVVAAACNEAPAVEECPTQDAAKNGVFIDGFGTHIQLFLHSRFNSATLTSSRH